MRVLLDVDGVIADFSGLYLRLATIITGCPYSVNEVTEWNIAKAIKLPEWAKEKLNGRLSIPGLAREIEALPGAVRAVKRIAEIADVYFVTAPLAVCPTWAADREAWLVEHFGASLGGRVISTSHKGPIAGDVMIDDKPENLDDWVSAGHDGVPLLWDAPYNRKSRAGRRVGNWREAITVIETVRSGRAA